MKLHHDTSVSPAAVSENAPILLLGPSLGTSHHLWDRARAWLEPHMVTVAWDLPGHGASPSASDPVTMGSLARAVLAIADESGARQFHYAGESIGGAIGLELARIAPERLASLTIVCSAAKIGSSEAWRERAALVREQGVKPIIEATPARWFADQFREEHAEIVVDMLAELESTNSEDYALLCEALAEFDARAWLSEIDVPTLVLAGELDPVTPPAQGQVIAESIGQGRLEIVLEASHQAVVEQPERVATLIREFVKDNS